VRINTDDPMVLMLIDVNVSGGSGGAVGAAGTGGEPGHGGVGGGRSTAKQQWGLIKNVIGATSAFRSTGGGYSPVSPASPGSPTSPMPVRLGKNGQRGKVGKAARNDPNTLPGAVGAVGKLTLCVYSEMGLLESAGYPYHLSFSNMQVGRLKPRPWTYGEFVEGEETFWYGQEMHFGPFSPVNIGLLSSPDSTMELRILVNGQTEAREKVGFGSVPPSKGARMGELPRASERGLRVRIPEWSRFSQLGLKPPSLPWPDCASPSTVTWATFQAFWAVGAIPFKPDKVAPSELSFEVELKVPVCLQRESTEAAGLVGPASMAIGGNGGAVDFTILNLLTKTKLRKLSSANPAACEYLVRVSAKGFVPSMVGMDPNHKSTLLSGAKTYGADVWCDSLYYCSVPEIAPAGSALCRYEARLPDIGASEEGNIANPGATFRVRVDLLCGGQVVEHSAPIEIRVAPPLPGPAAATSNDVLFVTGPGLVINDYKILSALCSAIGRQAHFLDWNHFFEPTTGTLPGYLWAPSLGRATVVFAPTSKFAANAVRTMVGELQVHNRKGGAVIVSRAAGFPSLNGTLDSAARSVAILNDDGLVLTDLCHGNESVTGEQVHGAILTQLLRAMLTTIKVEEKLDIIKSGSPMLLLKLSSLEPVSEFVEEHKVGCCGGSSVNYNEKVSNNS
jgi:hypothetical protein